MKCRMFALSLALGALLCLAPSAAALENQPEVPAPDTVEPAGQALTEEVTKEVTVTVEVPILPEKPPIQISYTTPEEIGFAWEEDGLELEVAEVLPVEEISLAPDPDADAFAPEAPAASDDTNGTEAAAALKAAERRLAEMAVLIKDVTTCKELRPLLQEYQRAADKKQFRRKHEGTLILYEAAAKALKEQGFQKLPDLYALKNEYKQLAEQKDQMQRQYNDAKRQMQEYGIIKQNVDGILRTAPGKEQMQER